MQDKKMQSILSSKGEGDINDSETDPPAALPRIDLPNASTDEEISEDEEKGLHEKLWSIQTLVQELPVGFNYKGWITHKKDG